MDHPISNAMRSQNNSVKLQAPYNLIAHSQSNPNIYVNTILPVRQPTHEAVRISALAPLVVYEASQYQTTASPKMVPQNVNSSSQHERQRMQMNSTISTSVNIQTATKSSSRLTMSNKSIASKVRFKEDKLSCTPDKFFDLTLE